MSPSAPLARWRRSRGDRRATLLVLGGLTVFVAVTYVVIVLGGGALIGHTDSPHLGLSLLATAVVALGFEPVQARLERRATRAVHGGRPSPYDVLSRFAEAVTGPHGDEVPVRMARVLAEGTGAAWSEVWLVGGDRPTLAATWPPDAVRPGDRPGPTVGDGAGRRSLDVRRGGELLGVLVVQERPHAPMSSVEERLFAGLAAQAGMVLQGVRLRTELEQRADELSARAEELTRSRQRLVDDQDAARRSLERELHDGAQQHLVALAVNLRLAQTLADRSPDRACAMLESQQRSAVDAIETLVRLSRGIYPPLLTGAGLAPALEAAIDVSPLDVELDAAGIGRYPARLEAAAYSCSLEALQNATKHAGATRIRIRLRQEGDELVLTVEDNGTGFDATASASGSGLANMRDRMEALDGTLHVESSALGTRIRAGLPATSGV